jgi:hypothetical protein
VETEYKSILRICLVMKFLQGFASARAKRETFLDGHTLDIIESRHTQGFRHASCIKRIVDSSPEMETVLNLSGSASVRHSFFDC